MSEHRILRDNLLREYKAVSASDLPDTERLRVKNSYEKARYLTFQHVQLELHDLDPDHTNRTNLDSVQLDNSSPSADSTPPPPYRDPLSAEAVDFSVETAELFDTTVDVSSKEAIALSAFELDSITPDEYSALLQSGPEVDATLLDFLDVDAQLEEEEADDDDDKIPTEAELTMVDGALNEDDGVGAADDDDMADETTDANAPSASSAANYRRRDHWTRTRRPPCLVKGLSNQQVPDGLAVDLWPSHVARRSRRC